MGYECIHDHGYLTLSIIYGAQSDSNILEYFRRLQSLIRTRIETLGFSVLEKPGAGEGLYIYNPQAIHCSLIDNKFQQRPTFDQLLKMDLKRHPWMVTTLCDIKPFEIQPRWFFAFHSDGNFKTQTTCSFAIQVYIEQDVVEEINSKFKGVAKVYTTGVQRLVRAATVLARFISPRDLLIGDYETAAIAQLFNELHSTFRNPRNFLIDRLTIVRSDSWLSNPDPEVKVFQLKT